MLAQLPADWNKRDAPVAAADFSTATGAAAVPAAKAVAKIVTGSIPSPKWTDDELDISRGKPPPGYEEDTDEKRTYSSVVEPTAYLARRADREREVRSAQLRSFGVRLRYSGSMFRTHYATVRDMLDDGEKEAAHALLEHIDCICDDCVEGIAEAAAVFKDADEFRVSTTQRYIDPAATRVTSSIYFSY